ncbi:hypothetical protein AK812_SmicGene28231 [Symbiodinium microadriaticum]|uniref:Uncharacterized protein n=1 Tax=Symbiodinium microadriaticum TaxID=2951 RepID=A0A1Q9D4W4_SYMMI|nr:hypothetical protein AK812_SmicGene28231 [Symbiodinium microadriaticum]
MQDACSSLGAVLISLASAMSQSLLLPLESFHRGASADHLRKKAALDGLREQELSCSNSVTESLQKRDRARVGLQSAMREQEKAQKKAGEKKKGLARFTRGDGEKDIAAAEMKVQKAASAQTASIEELASRTEEANEARLLRESATKEVDLLLSYIETVRTRLLSRCLNSCALAYGEAAKNLRKSAADLQSQVSFLRQAQSTRPEMPASGSDGRESSLPSWAMEALKVSKKRPSTIVMFSVISWLQLRRKEARLPKEHAVKWLRVVASIQSSNMDKKSNKANLDMIERGQYNPKHQNPLCQHYENYNDGIPCRKGCRTLKAKPHHIRYSEPNRCLRGFYPSWNMTSRQPLPKPTAISFSGLLLFGDHQLSLWRAKRWGS